MLCIGFCVYIKRRGQNVQQVQEFELQEIRNVPQRDQDEPENDPTPAIVPEIVRDLIDV